MHIVQEWHVYLYNAIHIQTLYTFARYVSHDRTVLMGGGFSSCRGGLGSAGHWMRHFFLHG